MPATIDPNLAVGAILFILGAIGVLTRRNLLLIVLSAEMMLHGVALTLVSFSHLHGNNRGQIFTIFVLTVAACEAGLGLALILSLFQRTRSLDLNLWGSIREADLSAPVEENGGPVVPGTDFRDLPRLTPAGAMPDLDGPERTLLAGSDSSKTSVSV